MKFHPLSNIFPLMEGEEFDEFVDDIMRNGCYEPIVVHDGMILDGRNRYRACELTGQDYGQVQYFGNDPRGFVISLNLHRRHLSKGAIAQVRVRLATIDINLMANVKELAEETSVGTATIERARKIEREAPDLADRVIKGELSQPKALEHLSKRKRAEKVDREADVASVIEDIKDEGAAQLYFEYAIATPIVDLGNNPKDDEPKAWLLGPECKEACSILGVAHSIIKDWIDAGCDTTPLHIKLIEMLKDRSILRGRLYV